MQPAEPKQRVQYGRGGGGLPGGRGLCCTCSDRPGWAVFSENTLQLMLLLLLHPEKAALGPLCFCRPPSGRHDSLAALLTLWPRDQIDAGQA